MNEENQPIKAEGFWKEHFDIWKASDLTQLKYCEQEGISCTHFVYQHTKLTKKPKQSRIQFIEAECKTTKMNNPTAWLQPMLLKGVRIGISNDINARLLQIVLTIAGGLRC